MRLFYELAVRSFKRTLAYRAAAIAGVITNFFFGLINAAVLVALMGDNTNVEGFSVQSVITYTGLSQALIAYLMVFGSYELMESVHSGEVASDLLKPMRLFYYHFAQDFGRAFAHLLLRGFSIMFIYALIFDLSYPQTVFAWVALLVSLLLAWLVSFSWRFLVNLTAFWSPNAKGFGRLAFLGSMFFSGMLMPLDFFPEWVQAICYATPFPYMLYTLNEIYLGLLTPLATLQALAIQLAWGVGLAICAQLVLRTGVRRLVILGG